MSENNYLSFKQKANRYERLPKSSNAVLQHYRGNFSATLRRSIRATTCRTGRKNAVNFATKPLDLTHDLKMPKSGGLCAESSSKVGRLKSSRDGLKLSIQDCSPAMRLFTNGYTARSANGSPSLFDLIADDYPAVILTGTKSFMSPREHRSKNGPNQFLQDGALAIGRPTP